MSIEMDNPQTVGEKADAAANLVEQMNLAHMVSDEAHFKKSHARAGELLFQLTQQIQREENPPLVAGPSYTSVAEAAYYAYKANTGGVTFDMRPMPDWEDLGVKVQTAWEAAIREVELVFGEQGSDKDRWAGWVRPK